ncbi:FAD-dependent oxidoreductase [candidate division WOR-3 bacterium]|nr:FAD-dependent oxidoreductase [candidate division WOR-3 bacterium]
MDFSIQKKEKDSGRKHFAAAIIGSGPAGLTAAIYLGRSKVETVVFEKVIPGGYVVNVEKIENYPGFVEGIAGEQLGKLYAKHAEKFGAEIKCEEVTKLELNETPFRILTSLGSYTSDSIILATGTSNRKLGIPGEEEFTHKGISFCATCDAPFFEGENVIVVGAGNSGAQESLYLSRFAKHITIVELLEFPTAEPILIDRLNENERIDLLTSHSVTSFNGDKLLSSVDIKDIKSGEIKNIKVKGAFIYAGEVPNNDLVKDALKLDDKGFIVTDERLRTSIGGVFAAGDVRNTPLRQVATSVGDGAIAGHEAYRFLEERK